MEEVMEIAKIHGLAEFTHSIGKPDFKSQRVSIIAQEEGRLRQALFTSRATLQQIWSETSYRMQARRDNPITAWQEFDRITQVDEPPMPMKLTFDVSKHPAHALIEKTTAENLPRPQVAILREQGVNGHNEMAAAFLRAGFDAVDVTMTALIEGRKKLSDFQVIAACGGFSYGDVLGAGRAWAQTILENPSLRTQFSEFFSRKDTAGIGVCNGNQMLTHLKEIIP